MRSPVPTMTVIACPHCGTRYQVPTETLGARGREVQCAHCARSWLAVPGAAAPPPPGRDPDRMFDEQTERDLDAAFVAEEQAVAAASPPPAEAAPVAPPPNPVPDTAPAHSPQRVDPGLRRKRAKDFVRRQNSRSARLPIARLRRLARLVTVGLLLALVAGGVAFRTEIVRYFPDLAGAYAAFGLEVNTVGLEFRDVHTVLSLSGGATVIKVQARIYSVAPRAVAVPPVVVTLLDGEGTPLYEWSVSPDMRDLEPGEVVDFASQLSSPPAGAQRVRLTFAGGRTQSETPISTPTFPQQPAH